ncbi:hypothetical protein AG1IA_07508 [Rhizoctonia solani AG-1 IA]|uniref:Uncharacterized protein n=1 Tax=Thanatephorus cucumeris (strain AG1-IA) TaxID=983506 RepID=L8WNX6_THACA|nr:hypothetical protein AG1IA_07508 [Rhizoctonia solani AG-1 IA]
MDFALQHWSEIRSSDSMKQVLSELRSGKYPGYEEVMHQLLGYLEYHPPASEGSGNDSGQEGMAGVGRLMVKCNDGFCKTVEAQEVLQSIILVSKGFVMCWELYNSASHVVISSVWLRSI